MKPASLLSKALQSDSADIVSSIESTLKSVKAFKSLSQQNPCEWPMVQLIKSRIKENDAGEKEYQGSVVPNFDTVLEQCKVHVLADLQQFDEELKERLQWTDKKILRAILVFVETQSW